MRDIRRQPEQSVADPEGGRRGRTKISLKCDKTQATLRNRSKSLELKTPEHEQSKNLGLVCLKGAESVKRMTSKYKFLWLVGQSPATFTPPLTKIPGSAPG